MTSSHLTVVLATKEDAPACVEALSSSEIGARYFTGIDHIQTFIEEGIEKGEIWVAWYDKGEAPVGYIWYTLHGAFYRLPYLRNIAVHPSYRGRGVGTALLRHFEENGFKDSSHVILLVSDFNTGAIKLYEKRGYKKVGEVEDLFVKNITEIIMVKRRDSSRAEGDT